MGQQLRQAEHKRQKKVNFILERIFFKSYMLNAKF